MNIFLNPHFLLQKCNIFPNDCLKINIRNGRHGIGIKPANKSNFKKVGAILYGFNRYQLNNKEYCKLDFALSNAL